jgi:hypothetical protein
MTKRAERVRAPNDELRTTGRGGEIVATRGLLAYGPETVARVFAASNSEDRSATAGHHLKLGLYRRYGEQDDPLARPRDRGRDNQTAIGGDPGKENRRRSCCIALRWRSLASR